jgi:hypothetical protein
LDGPEAEINCNDFTLSQVASPTYYLNGLFFSGICLTNGAVARNCNVQKFYRGLLVRNGGEVRSSFLTSNYNGMDAIFFEASTVTIDIENTDASNNAFGLYINVYNGVFNAKLNMEGSVTFNSNRQIGIDIEVAANHILDIVVKNGAFLRSNSNIQRGLAAKVSGGAKLNVDVKENGTFESCGNNSNSWHYDIYGNVLATATATFSGTGYTCSSKQFINDGTVVEPVCQPCT